MDYNIIVNRKKIKNIYIRIDDDFNVVVNANKRVNKKYIYELIRQKEDWINERILTLSKNRQIDSLDGKKIIVLGEKYKINVIISNKNEVKMTDSTLNLYSTNEDIDFQINIINDYLKRLFLSILNDDIIFECKNVMGRYIDKCDFNIKVRLMKTRFGSYSSKTNSICLNLYLTKYDREVIKSVLFHEMCHIKHMNHQRNFYKLLYKVCPDYDTYSVYLKRDFNYSKTWFLE